MAVRSLTGVLTALAAGLLLGGCAPQAEQGPKIGYYPGSAGDLLNLRRVVMIELDYDPRDRGPAEAATQAIFQSIQERMLFQMQLMSRSDPLCRDLPLDCRQTFTLQQLERIRSTLKCDAVLLGAMRDFLPHPRMRMGVSLVLLDLRGGQALWVVDYTWDTTEHWTVKRIRRHHAARVREGYRPLEWQLALRSPRALAKFVAWEIANTLPGGAPAPPPRPPTIELPWPEF